MKTIGLIGVVLAYVLLGSPVFAQDPEEVNVAVAGDAEVSVSVVGSANVDMALIGDTEVGLSIDGDAPEIDIDIEGNQTQLGIDITGNDSAVTINGVTPFVTYHTSGSKWAKNQVKDVILPWMAEAEDIIALNADDLASAILLAQSNKHELNVNDYLLESYADRLADLKSEVGSLGVDGLAVRIGALEAENEVMREYMEYQTAYYNYQTANFNQTAFYNKALMIMGALVITAFGLWMRARRKI